MNKRYWIWVGLIGAIIAAAVWQFRLRFPFDDVFISFRYAEHLAGGYGLVWNIGGPPTEGYTNFLFILILASVRLFTTHLLANAQAIGLASTVFTGILILSITSRIRDPKTGIVAAILYFLTPLTWINGVSGMETSLFVMLCVLAIFFATLHKPGMAFLSSFLAVLTRPEGVLLAGIIFVVIVSLQPFQRTKTLRELTIFIVLCTVYAFWKWLYFGNLLPNSFYVKVIESSGAHSHVLPGMQYVRLFVTSTVFLIGLTFGIRGWRNSTILISTLWVVWLMAFYLFVLPLEGLYDRFLWPAFPLLTITAAVGAKDIAERFHVRFSVLAIILIVAHCAVSFVTPRTRQSLAAHEDVWDRSMDPIVSTLRSLPHSDSLRLAYGDAGYVVYKSGIHHIDLFGLNDTRIAHAKTNSNRRSALEEERPDVFLLPVARNGSDYNWIEDAYGVTRDTSSVPTAIIEAFPYPLVYVLNARSPYYSDCRAYFMQQLQNSNGYFTPAPTIR